MTTEDFEWADFLERLESEGGINGMLEWGGWESFPIEVQDEALAYSDAVDQLNAAINAHDPQFAS